MTAVKVCPECAKEFESTKKNKKYCCKECGEKQWRKKNKIRVKERSKQYYNEHKNHRIETSKLWKNKNVDHYKKIQKQWRDKNKSHIAKCRKERFNNDIEFKIKCNLRSRLYSALKSQKIIKSQATFDLVGCSINELQQYIQTLFTKGMTWQNHGYGNNKWHIDHIKPCDAFNLLYEDEQRKCFNWTNLQPLWQLDNFNKSNKY